MRLACSTRSLSTRVCETRMTVVPDGTLAPDLYGLGNSVRDWAYRVLEGAGDHEFLVVGSVGRSCALEIAASAPDRVAAVVLIDAKAAHHPKPALRDEVVRLLRAEGRAGARPRYWHPHFAHTPNDGGAPVGPAAREGRRAGRGRLATLGAGGAPS